MKTEQSTDRGVGDGPSAADIAIMQRQADMIDRNPINCPRCGQAKAELVVRTDGQTGISCRKCAEGRSIDTARQQMRTERQTGWSPR